MALKRKPKPPKKKRRGAGKMSVEERVDRIAFLMMKGRWSSTRAMNLSKAWGISLAAIGRAADRASVKVELAGGKMGSLIATAHGQLEKIGQLAEKDGKYAAAIRSIELRLRIAGALSHRPGRGLAEEDGPRGLPPELARLDPPPSIEELGHFASVERPEDCALDACRVHGKAAPSPRAVH